MASGIVLNDQQKEAVHHHEGPCFVCAVPGAGKTRVIVERAVRLIEHGINPHQILCITFTNKAAGEMKERIAQRIGDVADSMYVSTFHSLCANVIRQMGHHIGYSPSVCIYDSSESEDLMLQVSRQFEFDYKKADLRSLAWKINDLREKLIPESQWFDECKAGAIPVDHQIKIMKGYVEKLKLNNAVDFSGLLSETVHLLKTCDDVREKLQSRFSFIQVDEAQDTNYCQFEIVRLLGLESHKNVFVVGDPDQAIYTWRGARYENIQDFINDYKAKVIQLPQNYRSTPEIVASAGRLIKHNSNRQDVKFVTQNKNGSDVECFELQNPDVEAMWIASKIQEMKALGYGEGDIAILYRLNSMSRSLENALAREGVEYKIIGGMSFFDRAEIKDALSMLKFVVNPDDGIAFERFINKPAKSIGPVTLGKIENFAKDKGINLVEAVSRRKEYLKEFECRRLDDVSGKLDKFFAEDHSNKSIGQLIDYLVRNWDYYSHLEKYYQDKGKKNIADRKQNLDELISSAHVYSKKKGNNITAYLNNIALSTSTDKSSETGKVSLMTLHASKGLEFPIVFMPRMEDDMLPFERAVMEDDRPDGLQEERRLCYVGMTRAQEELFLSYPRTRQERFRRVNTERSRFFKEMEHDKDIIQIW